MKSHKALFSRALAQIPAHLHAAAHSHHLRPDVIVDAQNRCAEDAFRLADNKWDEIFGTIVPAAQNHVARLLKTGQPDNVVFATNCHEFVARLLSCLPSDRAARILTTDSEFHSAARQFRRQEEAGLATVTRIRTEPFGSLSDRLIQTLTENPPFDMIFLSHVFFNSGAVMPDLEKIVDAVLDAQTFIVIDGYHHFMAMPLDLSALKDRIFYMAGGYKYAMSGEGSCFLHVPDGYGARPVNTGWFAGFDTLDASQDGAVSYRADASRFAGSTFDHAGLYRFNAVMDLLMRENITVAAIHERVRTLQNMFVAALKNHNVTALPEDSLMLNPLQDQTGHFLTFRTVQAATISQKLMAGGLFTDTRGDRLRFGFGLYHDPDDMNQMAATVSRLLS